MVKFTKRIIVAVIIGLLLIVAPYLKDEQGHVIIDFAGYTVSGSVIQFGITIVTFSLLIWLAVWLLQMLYTTLILPTRWWQSRQNSHQANFLQSGIDYMTLGQWQQAINQFAKVKRADRIDSAEKLTEVCHAQLDQTGAILLTDNSSTTSKLTSEFAKLATLLKQEQYNDALLSLQAMKLNLNKQPLPFQQLALAIFAHNFSWNEVADRLPKLNKQANKQSDSNATNELQRLNQDILHQAFCRYVQSQSVNQLLAVWRAWPKNVKNDFATRSAYINTLSEHKQTQLIENELLQVDIAKHAIWLLDTIRHTFLNLSYVEMDQLFAKVQILINKSPDNKVLITVYAYLAAGQKDHQLAKQALEQVVYSNKNEVDKRLYAMVLAELGELRYSVDIFKSIHVT